MLDKYEELNLTNYTDGNESKMIFCNTQATDFNIKEEVSNMSDNLKNPYISMYHWVKGEIFDIEAINNSLTIKDKIQ